MLPQVLLWTLTLAPAFVNAGLWPKDTLVKPIDAKGFRKVMKKNETSLVAFTAPWCGHCQRMAPELSKAALGLHPLIPTYAVDCDAQKNKPLCAEQGVQGFPTVKLFPRGDEVSPILFNGERTATNFYYFAENNIPLHNRKIYYIQDIEPWAKENINMPRVLLVAKPKTVPMLWRVLSNKYKDKIVFASHKDWSGKSSKALGLPVGGKKDSKVLVYPVGSIEPVLFQGILKFDSLTTFFDSLLDGTADLSAANEAARNEEYEMTPEEKEIERQQEAQKIALAHGGFADLIDFEEAIKKHGTGFHDTHGFGGAMGDMRDMPLKKEKSKDDVENLEKKAADEAIDEALKGGDAKEDDPVLKIMKAQKEKDAKKKEAMKETTPKTGDAGKIISDAKTLYEEQVQPETAAATATSSIAADEAKETTPVEETAESDAETSTPPEPTSSVEPEAETKEDHSHVKGEL